MKDDANETATVAEAEGRAYGRTGAGKGSGHSRNAVPQRAAAFSKGHRPAPGSQRGPRSTGWSPAWWPATT